MLQMIFFLQLLWEAQEDADPWWPLCVFLWLGIGSCLCDWRRVLFVRHPVPRILSGFLQIARFDGEAFWKAHSFNQSHGAGPDAFELWLRNSTFQQEYDPNCGEQSTKFSLDSFRLTAAGVPRLQPISAGDFVRLASEFLLNQSK